jgi:hypothetical protein
MMVARVLGDRNVCFSPDKWALREISDWIMWAFWIILDFFICSFPKVAMAHNHPQILDPILYPEIKEWQMFKF